MVILGLSGQNGRTEESEYPHTTTDGPPVHVQVTTDTPALSWMWVVLHDAPGRVPVTPAVPEVPSYGNSPRTSTWGHDRLSHLWSVPSGSGAPAGTCPPGGPTPRLKAHEH